MIGPRYTSVIADLSATVPFVGPETQERERGAPFRARIGANENIFGPSPKAIKAMEEATRDVWKYGDPENYDIKHALAEYHGVSADNIVVGEGIDGLLGNLVRLLVSEGAPVVTSLGAYPTFNYHVTGFGGELCTVPYLNDAEDPGALIQLARQKSAPLIYMANPDNPMGTWHAADTVQAMIEAVPECSLLCLDEAYIEFAPVDTAPPLDVSDTRIIRFRTFSKAYGMAGIRIGYGIAERSLIRSFDKIRNHFGVNRIAQAAALAALDDRGYLEEVQAKVAKVRQRIRGIAAANGLDSLPSATNFVAVDCGADEAYAKAVLQGLIERGIFVRMPQVAPQNRCIRISAGTDEDLDLLEEMLPQVLATVSKE